MPNKIRKVQWASSKLAPLIAKMSSHEEDDHEHENEHGEEVEEQEIHVDVDSDSRMSCGSGSDVDMDGGSCYDESETPLRWEGELLNRTRK